MKRSDIHKKVSRKLIYLNKTELGKVLDYIRGLKSREKIEYEAVPVIFKYKEEKFHIVMYRAKLKRPYSYFDVLLKKKETRE